MASIVCEMMTSGKLAAVIGIPRQMVFAKAGAWITHVVRQAQRLRGETQRKELDIFGFVLRQG